MTFKKDGADPIAARPNVVSRGGLSWVINTVMTALGLGPPSPPQPEDQFRYRKSGKSKTQQKMRKRPNMRHVSRRVRLKHRKARKAA